ncbi:MAG: SRPBCC family protein [Steroidobacteraceae bacterium]|jgi:hypothetical protein|nr:SRPBCC family protein [Steroidobacteraceae bacterium]
MLETRRQIEASADLAWNLLVDTVRWPEWGPSVRAVDCPRRFVGPGATGRVKTSVGPWLGFQITEWEEGSYWRWRVAGVPATGHRVIARGPADCEVVFEVPRWAPFYLPVCAAALRRIGLILRCASEG